ncbi:LOW QUALITY PROTEIN: cotranscriptional regulator FAM172A-like [Pecten maximus]|uniref:LOW QUALITY PROTEIN: cotranscriptional regulator FAM172A-like n=1 Tax=Pecten maximus TaxID=6579 RepID=UPI0014587A08|nr:LOW QUALITY PROTEIN: cotranscriptional regulator FAM172A-like [Pecten maximus]
MGNYLKNMSAKKSKEYTFPDTLEEFGYGFNDAGQLRHLETKEPFQFQVREDDLEYNQKRYEAMGEVITDMVYSMMEKDTRLQRISLPKDAKENEPQTFFFMSNDIMTARRLMILIHGSGAVRAGQWARKLIINDCLDSGTQLPFIRWAQEHGFSVIVANPNLNRANGERTLIRGNSSPEEHMETLWTEYVAKSQAKDIAIVAHSYGGVSTMELAENHLEDFNKRVKAVALTDSVHKFAHQKSSEQLINFYQQRARNWASAGSQDPLDSPLDSRMDFCPTVSAGTDRHDYTSYSSMTSIFKFIEEQFSGSKKKTDSVNKSKSSSVDPVPKAEKDKANENVKKSTDSAAAALESSAGETTEKEDTSNTQEMLSQQDTEAMSQDTNSQGATSDIEMDSQGPTSPKSEL